MSEILDGLRTLDSVSEADFTALQRRIARTFETEPWRRESVAAAVTCANLVATSALARERIARILKLLERIEERIARAGAAEADAQPAA